MSFRDHQWQLPSKRRVHIRTVVQSACLCRLNRVASKKQCTVVRAETVDSAKLFLRARVGIKEESTNKIGQMYLRNGINEVRLVYVRRPPNQSVTTSDFMRDE